MYLLNSQTAFIQIHLLFALAALLVGAAQLAFGKGTPQHRLLGRLWVAMIAVMSRVNHAFGQRLCGVPAQISRVVQRPQNGHLLVIH